MQLKAAHTTHAGHTTNAKIICWSIPASPEQLKEVEATCFFFINVFFLEFEIELFFSTEEKSIWTLTKIILKKTVKIVSDGTLKLYSVLFLTHFVEMEVCRKLCSACVSNILFLSHMFTSNIHPLISEIHSFPTMFMKGGSSFGRNGWKRGFSPKKGLKSSFLEYRNSGSIDFGAGWDLQF